MDERIELIDAMKTLVYLRMTNPRGGNGSIRLDDEWILVTPSGVAKHRLEPEDLVEYNIKTGKHRGRHKPSIEVQAHALIYLKNPSAKAVLHAHTPYTLALTDIGLDNWWKAGLVEIKYSVGEVAVAHPAEPGTLELAENIADLIAGGANIVIVPRHGVFAWGRKVHEALDIIVSLEEAAEYVFVRTVLDTLKTMSRRM